MAVTSYSTPLDSVSTDIELVGGKDAYLGMLREDRLGNRYELHKVKSGMAISDGVWVTAEHMSQSVRIGPNAQVPVVGANTTGKALGSAQYFWCMVYGTYFMTVLTNVSTAYKRLASTNLGFGTDIGADEIGHTESCGMSLEGRSATLSGKARCLIDRRSGYGS